MKQKETVYNEYKYENKKELAVLLQQLLLNIDYLDMITIYPKTKHVRVMKKKMKLNKKDWNELDRLLGKIGFGGYYDCIEVLRSTASKLAKDKKLTEDFQDFIREEDDLQILIVLINQLARRKVND